MPTKDTKISVLGDGGWGTTLALLLAHKGYDVCLWGAFADYVEQVRKSRENVKFLPGFKIPKNVTLTSSLGDALRASDTIVVAIPAQFLRGVLVKIDRKTVKSKTFVIVSKGIETRSLKVLSQVLQEVLGKTGFAVVSGPNIALEVAQNIPAAATVASKDAKTASRVRELFTTESFHLFETDDVLGVELGGSLKNVIAIGAGIVEGMGLGFNTRSVFFARGLAEIARMGQKMGASRETFMGLSGLGDLFTTSLSPHGRNHWLGLEIGRGKKLEELLKGTEMVVEGVETARSVYKLAKKHRVPMPISESVYRILFEKEHPRRILDALWKGGHKREVD